jgi:hypothetical protein
MPFTSENAKELGALGHKARAENKRASASIQKTPETVQVTTPQESTQEESFSSKLLTRARARIDSIIEMLTLTKDSKEVEQLTRALAALAELERKLDGRPLPGSRRPVAEKPVKSAGGPASLTVE